MIFDMQWALILAVIIVIAVGSWLWRRLIKACEAAQVADWGGPWLNRLDGLNRLFCRKFHRLPVGPIPLPVSGGVLVAANHVSGLDPVLMIAASPRPLRFLIAHDEYDRWWLRWLFRAIGCIPVERAANSQGALYAARQALETGEVVALFPHGRIALDHEHPVPIKRGIALLAQITGAPICPLRIEGVRGEGMKVMAVFLRSRARINAFPPLDCQALGMQECVQCLEAVLSPATAQSGEPDTTFN